MTAATVVHFSCAGGAKSARRWGLLLLAGMLLSTSDPSSGREDSGHEAQRQKLRDRIQTLQESLDDTRGRRDTVREEVRDLERRIGELLRTLRDLDARVRADDRKLGQLRDRARHERQNLGLHKATLERQVRAAYMMGQQEYSKMLLNQQDPASVARVLTYYQYLNRARTERINTIKSSLTRLNALEDEIREHNRALTTLRQDQQQKKETLQTARARRSGLLVSLNRQVRGQTQEIERLHADEKRLGRLLNELNSVLPDAPLPRGARLADMRGRLPLPTKGRVVARYGEQMNIGHLKWRGLFIAGREGQDVISVSRGRVAYADWLRGFGLLLILDHGDGYMTLYGHNQSLLKEVGDWVDAGAVIASLGSTGDAPQPGLYFEIRYRGEPRDPMIWCKTR
ncbi:MAG: peptidoglycan DD-metalloendopeptidase family protein [Pseudomonadota bacterium]